MSEADQSKFFSSVPLASSKHQPFRVRLVASMLSRALTRLGVLHDPSFEQGHVAGYAMGKRAGEKAGHKVGYAEGLEEGKQVLEVVDRRSNEFARPGIDNNLFDSWSLPIDESLRQRVIADVQAKLPAYKQPTDDQWRMIFSTTPSTCVVAGAGSGKSTTLVLRILLLHHYLGFELSSLTVVTFTNMSRWDFVAKLIETFALWGIDLPFKEAKDVVCTFHSKILTFVR
ncbi:UvrD-helicase domain-containing protein, partial [Burkholderia oklahomensis]